MDASKGATGGLLEAHVNVIQLLRDLDYSTTFHGYLTTDWHWHSSVQALQKMILSEGKPLFFSETATEEELSLVELHGHNAFTAAQMISFAYTEGLEFGGLLSQCARAQGVQHICHGVTPAVAEAMASEVQKARTQAENPAADVNNVGAANAGQPQPDADNQQRKHGRDAPVLPSELNRAGITDNRDAMGSLDDRGPPTLLQAGHEAVHTVTPIVPMHIPQRRRLPNWLPSQPLCHPEGINSPASDEQRSRCISKVPHAAGPGHGHDHQENVSQLQGSSPCLEPVHSAIAGQQWPSHEDQCMSEMPCEVNRDIQDHKPLGRGLSAGKRPFSCLKNARVTVDQRLLPPEIGMKRQRHCEPRNRTDSGMQSVQINPLPKIPGLQQDLTISKVDMRSPARHSAVTPEPTRSHGRHGTQSEKAASPMLYESSTGHCTGTAHDDDDQPPVGEVLLWDTNHHEHDNSDVSLDDTDLQSLLQTQGKRYNCTQQVFQNMPAEC